MWARSSRPGCLLAAALALSGLTVGCAGGDASASKSSSRTIHLVAYSTPQKAYDALAAQFVQTTAGRGASLRESFGASGAQSRAVAAGQAADVVAFSLAPDITKLVSAGLVPASWNSNQYKGMVTDSVVVLVVRKGNPKQIHGWADLVRPGVKVVTPNVFSSGSAKWNLLAAYGAQLKDGRSTSEALAYVKQLLQHSVTQPESGSKATATFVGGVGDVLISYENEAIQAQQSGAAVEYVTPADTILIENPIAVTSHPYNAALAKAFLDYLYTDRAQKTFAAHGYRPVVRADLDSSRFPTPARLFTIDDLGGWAAVNKAFFDPSDGAISKIENSLGVSGG